MFNRLTNIRNNIYKSVREEILGPGSEQIGIPIDEEIITDRPSKRYSTGILFTKAEEQNINNNENLEDNDLELEDNLKDEENEEAEEIKNSDYGYTVNEEFYENINNSHIMKRSSMGMTFFCDKNIDKLLVHVSGARYREVKVNECKIKYDGDLLPLEDPEIAMAVFYEDGFLKLRDRIEKSFIDKFDEKGYFVNRDELKNALYKLLKQCSKRNKSYKRVPINFKNPYEIYFKNDRYGIFEIKEEELKLFVLRRTNKSN